MASLHKQGGNRPGYKLRFRDTDNRQRVLWLGDVSKRNAETDGTGAIINRTWKTMHRRRFDGTSITFRKIKATKLYTMNQMRPQSLHRKPSNGTWRQTEPEPEPSSRTVAPSAAIDDGRRLPSPVGGKSATLAGPTAVTGRIASSTAKQ